MHYLLENLLGKRGVKDTELTPEERDWFSNQERILSKEELTTEDIKIFCERQIQVIEGKWSDLTTDRNKKAELIPYHTVYKLLLGAIDSPKSAREAVEIQLNQLINS